MTTYNRFLMTTDRVSSQKQIALVKPELFEELIKSILEDAQIEDDFKAFVLITISGGMRVSEVKALKKEDFSIEEGRLFVRQAVLKKRKDEKRWAMIHPLAQSFVETYIEHKIGFIVKDSQQTLHRKMRALFGAKEVCNHSLRHSSISYLMDKQLTHLQIAKVMHVSLKIVERYSHLDEKKTLRKIF